MWTGSDKPGNFLGRISIRRNQVVSMEGQVEDLEYFQKKISDHFSGLLISNNYLTSAAFDGGATPSATITPLLSITWLRKLLDSFLCTEGEFMELILNGRDCSQIVKPPVDRLINDYLERSVKCLDICNGISHGIDAVLFMHNQARIVLSALEQRPFTDGQIRRARRALSAVLAWVAVEEKDGKSAERQWSFGRRSVNSPTAKERLHSPSFRSLSWCVGKNWSAAKQIQALSSNLYPPRGGESSGLSLTIYIMNVVMVFVMWALVAAIPCQERTGLGAHISIPKQFGWAQSLFGLQEKIGEEWKRKEKKGSAGLMDEIVKVEKLAQSLVGFVDNFQFPMEDQKEVEVAGLVVELADTCQKMEEGLDPLQQQIRETFHRLVKDRTTMFEFIDKANKSLPNA